MLDTPLQSSAVFKALTRPQRLFGVDYTYALIEGLLVFIVFINTSNFLVGLMLIPLHALGWVLCKMDSHIFQIIQVRGRIGQVKNKSLWGCQSYEAY